MAYLFSYLDLLPEHLTEDIIFSTDITYINELNEIYPVDQITNNSDLITKFFLDVDPEISFFCKEINQAETLSQIFNKGDIKLFMWLKQIIDSPCYYIDYADCIFFNHLYQEIFSLKSLRKFSDWYPMRKKSPKIDEYIHNLLDEGMIYAHSDPEKLRLIFSIFKKYNISINYNVLNETLRSAIDSNNIEAVKILFKEGGTVSEKLISNLENTGIAQESIHPFKDFYNKNIIDQELIDLLYQSLQKK